MSFTEFAEKQTFLAQGSYGKVLMISDWYGNDIAIKVQKRRRKKKVLLKHQHLILAQLNQSVSAVGYPKLYQFGKSKGKYYMMMQLLGDSLACRVERKQLLMTDQIEISRQLISLVQNLHDEGYIHRDIKPQNSLFGRGDNKKQLYLIDFGFAKKIEEIQNYGINSDNGVGSLDFCSVNTHIKLTQNRRDDMQSVIYTIIYMLNGGIMPWSYMEYSNYTDRASKILQMKLNIEVMCQDMPKEIEMMLRYVRELSFDQIPDYTLLREWVSQIMLEQFLWNV